MYTLKPCSYIRPYSVPRKLDEFIATDYQVSDSVIVELLAYYRGESVTKRLVDLARDCYCNKGSSPPLPLHSEGQLEFVCSDGIYYPGYDVGTVCRHYELISDLYELDPSVSEVTLPFTVDEVQMAMSFEVSSLLGEVPLDCLMFLRPKRMETYLRYKWSRMDEDFARFIGRGLEKETKLHLSKFASALPDDELYPILEWATTMGQKGILYSLLEEKAPSVLLWCLVNGECSGRRKEYADDIVKLVRKCSFDDKVEVVRPWGMSWSLGDDEPEEVMVKIKYDVRKRMIKACWLTLKDESDPVNFRRLLASFGLRDKLLDNEDVIVHTPFNIPCSWYHRPRIVLEIILDMLMNIDQSFTEGMKKELMDKWYVIRIMRN